MRSVSVKPVILKPGTPANIFYHQNNKEKKVEVNLLYACLIYCEINLFGRHKTPPPSASCFAFVSH